MKLFTTLGSKIDNVFNVISEHQQAFVKARAIQREEKRYEEFVKRAREAADFQREVNKQLNKTEA